MSELIHITEQEAEVLLEVLHEYPQSIKWTIKGVNVDSLRTKLSKQLTDKNERVVTKVEFNVKPTTS